MKIDLSRISICGFYDFKNAIINLSNDMSIYLLKRPYTPSPCIRTVTYEGCSNMNASSFITFFTYMLRQNVILFWKDLSAAFKMTPTITKHPLYFLSYRRLYKGHSCILKFLKQICSTLWYMCGYSVIAL